VGFAGFGFELMWRKGGGDAVRWAEEGAGERVRVVNG
jgi:hypothetical protein